MGSGNDSISSTSTDIYGTGLRNVRTIDTGDGNDFIVGTGGNSFYTIFVGPRRIPIRIEGKGIDNAGGATINTGNGNDSISGTGFIAINNNGTIDTGHGNDSISGTSTASVSGFGIISSSLIYTRDGNDSISGQGSLYGILTTNPSGIIDTGDGNDSISGQGSRYGISNMGTIDTGNGNDSISGQGSLYGITNSGNIITGAGNDQVIASHDPLLNPQGLDFDGFGVVNLGTGNDLLSGFGTGKFYGGSGKDTLILLSGSYSVDSTTIGSENFITLSLGSTMNVSDFEILKIGNSTYDFANLHTGDIVS